MCVQLDPIQQIHAPTRFEVVAGLWGYQEKRHVPWPHGAYMEIEGMRGVERWFSSGPV